jgi:hypothetical protein
MKNNLRLLILKTSSFLFLLILSVSIISCGQQSNNQSTLSAIIEAFSPVEGYQGSSLTVEVTGKNINFSTNPVILTFSGFGVTAESVLVADPNHFAATIRIDNDAQIGTREVMIITSGESISVSGGFVVKAGSRSVIGNVYNVYSVPLSDCLVLSGGKVATTLTDGSYTLNNVAASCDAVTIYKSRCSPFTICTTEAQVDIYAPTIGTPARTLEINSVTMAFKNESGQSIDATAVTKNLCLSYGYSSNGTGYKIMTGRSSLVGYYIFRHTDSTTGVKRAAVKRFEVSNGQNLDLGEIILSPNTVTIEGNVNVGSEYNSAIVYIELSYDDCDAGFIEVTALNAANGNRYLISGLPPLPAGVKYRLVATAAQYYSLTQSLGLSVAKFQSIFNGVGLHAFAVQVSTSSTIVSDPFTLAENERKQLTTMTIPPLINVVSPVDDQRGLGENVTFSWEKQADCNAYVVYVYNKNDSNIWMGITTKDHITYPYYPVGSGGEDANLIPGEKYYFAVYGWKYQNLTGNHVNLCKSEIKVDLVTSSQRIKFVP